MGAKFAHIIGAGSKRPAVIAALAIAVLLAVVGSVSGYAAMSKTVQLSVDGKEREVTVLGSTVEDVLEDQGIRIGTHDLVAPGLEEQVTEGTKIAVQYGRPVELTVDGKSSTHWVTATSVDEALAAIGSPFARAELSVNRGATISRDGVSIEVVTPKKVTVRIAGAKADKTTVTALTVAEVLDELGVKVDRRDKVRPAPRTPVTDGDTIVFTDIRVVSREVKGEAVGFETVEREDPSIYEGEEEIGREGRTGARDVVYRLTFRNGEVVGRKVVRQTVTREPVSEIVLVGTKEKPEPEPTANYAGGSTVWDRLAQCESGGNWATNTGNGYYGGLQFSLSTWHSVGGSGYPHQASREEQIHRGQILQSRAGWGQWPHCAAQLGLI